MNVEELWQLFTAPFQKTVEMIGQKLLGADVYLRNAFFTVFFYEDVIEEAKPNKTKAARTASFFSETSSIIANSFAAFVKNSMAKNFYLNGAFTDVSFPAMSVNMFEIRTVNRIAPFYFPENVTYSEIELERGLTVVGSPFWLWLKKFHDTYEVEYKTTIIVHLARIGQVMPFLGSTFVSDVAPWFPARLLILYNSYLGGYAASDFSGLNGEVTIERVSLHFSNFDNVDLLEMAMPTLKKLGIIK